MANQWRGQWNENESADLGKPREEFLRTAPPPFLSSSSRLASSSADIMASESPRMDRTPPQTGSGDPVATPTTETAKRKAEQSHGTHTRTKRNRYISIAW